MDERDASDEAPSPSTLERAEELLREPTLWPVWLVVIGHAVVLLAPTLLMALRDHRASAALALAIVGVATLRGFYGRLRARRGLGPLHRTILITWLLAIALALAADHWGIF
jgi:hypothetical protein